MESCRNSSCSFAGPEAQCVPTLSGPVCRCRENSDLNVFNSTTRRCQGESVSHRDQGQYLIGVQGQYLIGSRSVSHRGQGQYLIGVKVSISSGSRSVSHQGSRSVSHRVQGQYLIRVKVSTKFCRFHFLLNIHDKVGYYLT